MTAPDHPLVPIPDGVRIRPATDADVPAMQAVEVDAGALFRAIGMHAVADDPPFEAAVLQGHIADGTAWVATATGSGRGPGPTDGAEPVLGYAIASVVDGEGHVDQVSILGSAAGRGIGAALVRQVCAWSRAAGHPSVTLTTFRDVPWNGPYYARLGFVEVRPDDQGPALRTIRRQEREAGLEPPERIAMRRPVDR